MAKNLYTGITYIATPIGRKGKVPGLVILDEAPTITPPSLEAYMKFLNARVRDKTLINLNFIVFHHDDMDGAFAAASAFAHHMSHKPGYSVNCMNAIPINYDRQASMEVVDFIKEGDIVFVLDFAFNREVTRALAEKAGFFLTLDHHKTNQEMLQGEPGTYFDMNASGAKMAWDYFFPSHPFTPEAITLADNRDLWRKTDGREDAFHEAMMIVRHKAEGNNTFIFELTNRLNWYRNAYGEYNPVSISADVELGKCILTKRDSNIAHATSPRRLAEMNICGYPAVMFNYCVDQSDACDYLYNMEKYRDHIVVAYSVLANGQVNLSFRRGPECSADLASIAEANFNGGGHQAAAGGQISLEVLGKMLSNKIKYALCWKSSEVNAILANTKLSTPEKTEYLYALKSYMVSRDICETDTTWKQIIPYVVIRNTEGEYFTYRRPSTSTEERLHGNSSIGVGGHIDIHPGERPFKDHIVFESWREIEEEIGVSKVEIISVNNLRRQVMNNDVVLLDTTDPAGIYHIGLGFVMQLGPAANVQFQETEVIEPKWVKYSDLKNLESPEVWTRVMIDNLDPNI